MPPLEMPEFHEALLRIAGAFVLSAIIGLERERPDRPAGLRTHVLVCVAACLLMMVSMTVAGDRVGADPGRVAAQVVTGMGFLGAGTIIRYGATVRGLTTAATLWTTSAIGLAIGLGWYAGAAMVTVGVYLTLTAVRVFERRLAPGYGYATLMVSFRAHDTDVGAVSGALKKLGVELRSIELGRPTEEAERIAIVVVRPPPGMEADLVAQELQELDAVVRAEAI